MTTKDFQTAASRSPEPVSFTIDGEEYLAVPLLPGEALLRMAKLAGGGESPGAAAGAVIEFLDTALVPESAERFAERFRSTENPITIEEAASVVRWLVEDVYQSRPTVPPSPSPSG
jgi:hypothetical protein